MFSSRLAFRGRLAVWSPLNAVPLFEASILRRFKALSRVAGCRIDFGSFVWMWSSWMKLLCSSGAGGQAVRLQAGPPFVVEASPSPRKRLISGWFTTTQTPAVCCGASAKPRPSLLIGGTSFPCDPLRAPPLTYRHIHILIMYLCVCICTHPYMYKYKCIYLYLFLVY